MADAYRVIHGQITGAGAGAAAKQIVAAGTAGSNAPAESILLENQGTGDIYIGGSAVDNTNGVKIVAGGNISINIVNLYALYAYLTNAQSLSYIATMKG